MIHHETIKPELQLVPSINVVIEDGGNQRIEVGDIWVLVRHESWDEDETRIRVVVMDKYLRNSRWDDSEARLYDADTNELLTSVQLGLTGSGALIAPRGRTYRIDLQRLANTASLDSRDGDSSQEIIVKALKGQAFDSLISALETREDVDHAILDFSLGARDGSAWEIYSDPNNDCRFVIYYRSENATAESLRKSSRIVAAYRDEVKCEKRLVPETIDWRESLSDGEFTTEIWIPESCEFINVLVWVSRRAADGSLPE